MSSEIFHSQSPEEPRVVFWYRFYCGAMAALYLLCTVAGVAILVFRHELAAGDPETAVAEMVLTGAILLVVGIVLLAAFAISFFLPRKRWAWIYHIVLICVGLSSCCTLPVSLPLLLYWIKPEAQAWFRD